MHNQRLLPTAALVLLAGAVPLCAQPRPGAAELPVTRVVLFSSGVGYFQRDGQVDGTARIDLQFPMHQINDLLKSLVLQDQGGGQVGAIQYDNRDPIDKTLKSFAIDLTANPSLGQLLNQVRGERVEIVSYGEPGREGQPVTLSGQIVGVQKHKRPAGKEGVVDVEQLNLLTAEGLQGVALGQVQRVRFLKPELEQEFRKALEILAAGHDKQKKTVSLNFLGKGKRAVRVGYVTESPIWKTSYRLALDGNGKAHVQGWAIVENTTDEDWNHVRLGLVSGRPVSFQMDLYEPLYVPRPVVEPELFASLRPPKYSGEMGGAGHRREGIPPVGVLPPGVPEPDEPAGDQTMKPRKPLDDAESRRAGRFGYINDFDPKAMKKLDASRETLKSTGVDFRQGAVSLAAALELGEFFQYEIEQPVSLARQKSALLPIVNAPIEAVRVSVYNEAVHPKFPLLGLRLKNTTGLHLMQGPITVLDGGTYAGDAQIADLQPKETRLLSYAVDLGSEVLVESPEPPTTIAAVKVAKGVLHATHKVRHMKTYTVKNRSPQPRVVVIEHPVSQNLTLVSPNKSVERSRDVYRFEVKAESEKTVKLEVVEDEPRLTEIALSTSKADAVEFYLRSTVLSARVRAALQEALKLQHELAETGRTIQAEENALQVIDKDQTRMRENMARVPKESEAFKRYLKKFDDQETEIEKRREKVVGLQELLDKQRKAYEKFLLSLDVE